MHCPLPNIDFYLIEAYTALFITVFFIDDQSSIFSTLLYLVCACAMFIGQKRRLHLNSYGYIFYSGLNQNDKDKKKKLPNIIGLFFVITIIITTHSLGIISGLSHILPIHNYRGLRWLYCN